MIRFPRALIAAAVGIGLSLCGIVMQAAVENPLADPYILGISSGATLGATFALMVGVGTLPLIGQASVSASAFAGALLASFLVLFFANIGDRDITGLYVRLEDAQNVALDPYWTVGETTTLSAFTTTEQKNSYGELANVAKIRLLIFVYPPLNGFVHRALRESARGPCTA